MTQRGSSGTWQGPLWVKRKEIVWATRDKLRLLHVAQRVERLASPFPTKAVLAEVGC